MWKSASLKIKRKEKQDNLTAAGFCALAITFFATFWSCWSTVPRILVDTMVIELGINL